jgi:hypothetical protein
VLTRGSVKVIAAFERLLETTGRNRARTVVETIGYYFKGGGEQFSV